MKYNGFWIKMISVVLIAGALLFYNQAAVYRNNVENFNKQLKDYAEQVEAMKIQEAAAVEADGGSGSQEPSKYNDGTYDGSAKGYGGNISLKVTVERDTITDIQVVSATNETPSYYNSAVSVIDSILDQQTADVDAVTGATYSSNGIKNAVKAALAQAEK